MENKYFLHRIQRKNGVFDKGIEVHDTLDDAILAYHGRMKLAGDPGFDFLSCMITNGSGSIASPFADTWKDATVEGNIFFMHYIRKDGEVYTKDIDILDNYDAAKQDFHKQMEYGYGNTKFPGMTFVSCQITDITGAILMAETWNLPDPEPEPEPEPDPEA